MDAESGEHGCTKSGGAHATREQSESEPLILPEHNFDKQYKAASFSRSSAINCGWWVGRQRPRSAAASFVALHEDEKHHKQDNQRRHHHHYNA
jgi:hypothetical protein